MRSRTKERRKLRSNKKKIHKNGDGEKKEQGNMRWRNKERKEKGVKSKKG